jgi:effector-binding domain-containing protein
MIGIGGDTIKTFEETYKKLEEWINKNKKIPSSSSKDLEEKQLGAWCITKRQEKKKNILEEEKIKLLEKINGWNWGYTYSIKNFNETYENLKEWIEINNKIPSYTSKDLEEKQLGIWCNSRRQEKKEK